MDIFGFIYEIHYTNGKKYLGKRQIWSVTKKHFGKKKLALITDKRLKTYEIITKESKWREYEGSSKLTKGLEIKSKTILEFCKDSKNLTYCEIKHLIRRDVLVDDTYLNDCISGHYYTGQIDKGI